METIDSRPETEAGRLMALGGLLAIAWGTWLLVAFVFQADTPPSASAIRRAAASQGAGGEALWLGANACWLAALAILVRRRRLAWPLLLPPIAGTACYLAACLLVHEVLANWPLRIPPTALGTIGWSLGMIAIGATRRLGLLPLAIGLFYPLAPLPLLFLLGHPPVYLIGIGWGLLWIALGRAVRQVNARAGVRVTQPHSRPGGRARPRNGGDSA